MVEPQPRLISGPATNAQLQQLFADPHFGDMKRLFCSAIMTNLKFRYARGCAGKLIEATEQGVQQGLNDSVIYGKLHDLVHNELFKSAEYLRANRNGEAFSREQNRTEQLTPILHEFLAARKGKIMSYLDVGCNEGNITAAIGTMLGAEKVCGCDVFKARAQYSDFEFTLLDPSDPYKLPYETGSQDVVTAFMSLHHIEQVERTLSEIRRVLRDDGILLIREHDCDPAELSLLLDLMHGFYAMVWANPPEMPDFSVHYSCYRTHSEVTALLQAPADAPLFKSVYQGDARGAWRYYYAIFVKGDSDKTFSEQARGWFANVPVEERQRQGGRDGRGRHRQVGRWGEGRSNTNSYSSNTTSGHFHSRSRRSPSPRRERRRSRSRSRRSRSRSTSRTRYRRSRSPPRRSTSRSRYHRNQSPLRRSRSRSPVRYANSR